MKTQWHFKRARRMIMLVPSLTIAWDVVTINKRKHLDISIALSWLAWVTGCEIKIPFTNG